MCPLSLSYPLIFLAILLAFENLIPPLHAELRRMLREGYEVAKGAHHGCGEFSAVMGRIMRLYEF
jgi:hypothetical protein